MPLSGYGVPDSGGYECAKSDLQYRYNTDRASNAYGRFLSQQRGQRSLDELSRGLSRGLPGFRAGFGQRGLSGPNANSGVQQRAMTNYLGDHARNYGQQQQDVTQELQQADLGASQLDAYYNQSLQALEIQKQNEIANAALAIEALRPLLGGL